MAELVGGAVLGVASSESWKSAMDYAQGAIKFDEKFNEFKSSVAEIEPIIRENEELDRKLGILEEETKMFTDQLEKEKKLIEKCSKTRCWNFWEKASNSKKIKKLEDSKAKIYQMNVQAMQLREIKITRLEFRKLKEKIEGESVCSANVCVDSSSCGAPDSTVVGLDEKMKGVAVCGPNELVGSCEAPEVPKSTVGLDVEMKGGSPVCTPNVLVGSPSCGSFPVLGAAVGAAFGELLKAVVEVKDKSLFKSILRRLESRLNSLEPIVREIERLDAELNCPPEEIKLFIDRLKEGAKLVRKCSKTQSPNSFKRPSYTRKLLEFEDLLVKFFQTEVQAMQTRDSKKILVKVKEIEAKLDRKRSSEMKIVGSSTASRVSDFVVGLDGPLQELKMKLLKDGVQLVALSAPRGYGKTTLAKMLCNDVQIKGIFKDKIIFVPFSRSPNLKVVYEMAEFQNEDDVMNRLVNILTRNEMGTGPKLLVVDGVCSKLESVIKKFMIRIPEYKILVTSSCACGRFDSAYELGLLNDEAAMALFRNSAFPEGGSCNIPDVLVNKIVRVCRGLPTALIAFGESLCQQPEGMWRAFTEAMI